MKILMLTPYLPYPLLSGGQIRSFNLLKNLASKHQITLVALIKHDNEKQFIPYIQQYCHKVIVATKGDLKDQHRKLHDSGIGAYFHHIEVMSDKAELDYEKMLGRLDCKAEDFLMIGNSLKSDVLPVLNIGGHAIHIPYHTTWEYEKIDFEIEHDNFKSFTNITEILPLLK